MSELNRRFWDCVLDALGTTPIDTRSIVGKSGLVHDVLAMGIDEVQKRIVIVSCDTDARTAVLAREDIHARYLTHKVVLTRPIPFTLAPIASLLCNHLGNQTFSVDEISEKINTTPSLESDLRSSVSPHVTKLLDPVMRVPSNFVSVFQEAISQIGLIRVQNPILNEGPIFNLEELVGYDVSRLDRIYGNCPFPLFELTEEMHDGIAEGDKEVTVQILRELGVMRYFFPEVSEVALGLVENLRTDSDKIVQAVESAPIEGHPLEQNALLASFRENPVEVIVNFKKAGYIIEVDEHLEITEKGKRARTEVRLMPQEGFISKISRIIAVKLDLKWPPV